MLTCLALLLRNDFSTDTNVLLLDIIYFYDEFKYTHEGDAEKATELFVAMVN